MGFRTHDPNLGKVAVSRPQALQCGASGELCELRSTAGTPMVPDGLSQMAGILHAGYPRRWGSANPEGGFLLAPFKL